MGVLERMGRCEGWRGSVRTSGAEGCCEGRLRRLEAQRGREGRFGGCGDIWGGAGLGGSTRGIWERLDQTKQGQEGQRRGCRDAWRGAERRGKTMHSACPPRVMLGRTEDRAWRRGPEIGAGVTEPFTSPPHPACEIFVGPSLEGIEPQPNLGSDPWVPPASSPLTVVFAPPSRGEVGPKRRGPQTLSRPRRPMREGLTGTRKIV